MEFWVLEEVVVGADGEGEEDGEDEEVWAVGRGEVRGDYCVEGYAGAVDHA